ncbi:MAG: hypothetical protein AB1665_07440 [Candidatus Thermoplasmatota archaeon]
MIEPKKRIDKTLEARDVTLLKHLLEMELRRMSEGLGIDIAFFMGVDGRIFASYIPPVLSASQFRLLNIVKRNIPYLCGQLEHENMRISLQHYDGGAVMISGVGAKAFLALIAARDVDIAEAHGLIRGVLKSSAVVKHIFELRALTPQALEGYEPEVAEELTKLSRQLFVEKFEETREYKKNLEVLNFLKKKVGEVLGIGQVDEVVTLTLNEMGTSFAYMTRELWMRFLEMVINQHVRGLRGDMVADECMRTWGPELERKLKTFM